MGSILELFFEAFKNFITIGNFLYLVGGLMLGVVMGAIPGLTATLAIALIIPMTYHMNTVTALVMLMGAYKGGCFGGSIPAILISAPGTPCASFTVADGYALAKQGKAGKALKMALTSSVMGDLFSDIVLVLVAFQISKVALKFGPPEYTTLILFSIAMIVSACGKSLVRGFIPAIFGMFIAMVGVDPITAHSRFSFGIPELYGQFETSMIIGLMAFSEVFIQVEELAKVRFLKAHLPKPKHPDDNRVTKKEFMSCLKTIFRSAVIGTWIGALPGIGTTVGASVSYNAAKRASKNPEEFGKGALEGIAAAEAGNNAVSGANLIPLLSLGIPGDLMVAILFGAFLLHGVTPGPLIFQQNPEVVYGLYAGLILANFVLFAIAYPSIKYFKKLAELPAQYIFPVVIIFCIVGSFAVAQNIFDIWVMLVFGVIGYFMRKFDFSTVTLLITYILGLKFERAFRQSLIMSDGSPMIFLTRPIALVFLVLTAVYLYFSIRSRYKGTRAAALNG